MLVRRVGKLLSTSCKRYTTIPGIRPVLTLQNNNLETFRETAFNLAIPALFPPGTFSSLPAIHKWFFQTSDNGAAELNTSYLSRFASTIVPLEFSNETNFSRTPQSLGFFLDATSIEPKTTTNIYLAQAPIPDLPDELQRDIPTPLLVLEAEKGDVYDSSIWLGRAPTYTPLHRDPNPNLFVQLAGKKVVRLCSPEVGKGIFARVQERINARGMEAMRGVEMMIGAEREVLEAEVWGGGGEGSEALGEMWQAELQSGDGLFVPKGWWHSVRSFGEGMTGSVNWWFR